MKLFPLAIALVTATTALSATVALSQSSENESVQFTCGQSYDPGSGKRVPTTFAWASRGKIAFVSWKSQVFKGYSPLRRCQEVSPKFQKAYENGTLNYLTNAIQGGQRVICSVRTTDSACDTVLFTLKRDDDTRNVLQQLNDILDGTAEGPVEQNGSARDKIYIRVDMQRFLQTAPVERNNASR
ncbi:MAG TPA: COP23 domain-containing protein [Candidatus Obscuribacterales bacterium]